MIEDALLEANKLTEEGVFQKAAGALINGAKKLAGGATGNQATQQGQNTQGNGQTTENQNQDQSQAQEEPAKTPDVETLKGYIKENPDIADWPADRLGELTAFLKTQKEFMSSKAAQANLQAIQDQEKQAEAEGKTEAPAEEKSDAPAGDASKVPQGDLTTVMSRLQQLGTAYTVDDLAAALKANGKK